MNFQEYASTDATGLIELLRDGKIDAKALSKCALEAIARVNPYLNAIAELYPERSETGYLAKLPQGPLRGLPILRKDLAFAESGFLSEMGSDLCLGMISKTSSTAMSRLTDSGVVCLGRTTTPEFGLTGTTESRLTGITRNPWNVERTPGGSSGGSAALVAAGAIPVATASDGGGSTRGPAAYCGLVGLKQTRGRISAGPTRAEGNSGLSASFVLTRTVRDCALFLDIMSGPGVGDPFEIALPVKSYRAEIESRPSKLRIAYMDTSWVGKSVSDPSKNAVHAALKALESEGHIIEEASPKFDVEQFIMATTIVACANLSRDVDALSENLQRPADDTTLQSTTLACHHYGKKLSAQDLLNALLVFNSVNRVFGEFYRHYDVLVTPTNLYPAPLIEDYYRCDPVSSVSAESWQQTVFENDSYLAPFNTTGQPALSLPLYETGEGIPVGVQFASRFGDEATLLKLAAFLEKALPWEKRRPGIHIANDRLQEV